MKLHLASLLALVVSGGSASQSAAPAPQNAPSSAPSSAAGALPGSTPQAADAPQSKALPAFSGTLRDARVELQQLCERAEHESAAQLADSVLASPQWSAALERERAEFHFAQGVARGAAQAYVEASQAAHAARGLAGSSELGLDSAYNAGTFRLMHAEALRREIPQIREQLQLPPLAQPPAGGAPMGPPGAETASDPIATARAAYVAARGDLIERWRADPAHVDTRANLELVARRLRELDELERQREQEQQSDPNQRQDPDQKQDPQQNQDQQQQNQEQPSSEPQQDQQQPQDPSEQDKQEQESEQKPGEDKSEQEQQPEEGEQPGEQQPDPKEGADPAQPQDERLLTPEEIQRLLQQLEKIEDQAAQVQAALRRARRVPVKRDW